MSSSHWEAVFEAEIFKVASVDDPAHDILHFRRVVKMAKLLADSEKARLEVVIPAAWFHDYVNVEKSSPLRNMASRMSAQKAIEFLTSVAYPAEFYEDIFHAIEAHSFSAGVPCRTIEARVVQDADRLDALGAIGIARCFTVAGVLKRELYSSQDPFCQARAPQDQDFTLDHFYQKLLKLPLQMQTTTGKVEAAKRLLAMQVFLKQLSTEI